LRLGVDCQPAKDFQKIEIRQGYVELNVVGGRSRPRSLGVRQLSSDQRQE